MPNSGYKLPDNFIESEDFLLRMYNEFFRICKQATDPDTIKEELNFLYLSILKSEINEQFKTAAHLVMLEVVCDFAQMYDRPESFKNIFNAVQNEGFVSECFKYYQVKALLTFGKAFFMMYEYEKTKNDTLENLELIMIAKFYLWQAYVLHIEKKTKIEDRRLTECLVLLSMCLAEVSRWDEAMHYLRLASELKDENHNVDYGRAIVIESFKEKTCASYSSYLLKKLIDFAESALKSKTIHPKQIEQLLKIVESTSQKIASVDVTIEKLNNHDSKIQNAITTYDDYTMFCLKHGLFLNEHSIFCLCGDAIFDTLKIETEHEHTKREKAIKYEHVLNWLVSDFVVARRNLFQSLDNVSLDSFNKNDLRRNDMEWELKCSLLREAFKSMYGILDKIARGTLSVLNKSIGENDKIYFTAIWGRFNANDYENFYLTSLNSIAMDLSRDGGALNDFKVIRNKIEHEILHVTHSNSSSDNVPDFLSRTITKDELFEKTKILMVLTKSAIHSFTYLIRRATKLEEVESKTEELPMNT